MEKYSVLMSVYKNENPKFLHESLLSVINQTVAPDEIVLVEDGPLTPELYDVINKFYDSHKDILKIVINDVNLGLGLALNNGLKHCSYELVARMDSDDICEADRMKIQLDFMNKNDVDIVGGDIREFIGDFENTVSYRRVPTSDDDIKKFLKKRCPFNHMTVLFKKKSVEDAGGYLDMHFNEDYYLWLRMYLNGCSFGNTGSTLVNTRIDNNMYKRRGGYKYYKSEKKLQKFMLKNKIINYPLYISNNFKRFIIQVLMPNFMRKLIYNMFARNKA